MNTNRKIAWEKFTCNQEIDNKPIIDEHMDEIRNEHDEDEQDEHMGFIHLEQLISMNKVKTPFGIYDLSDPFSPYNMFECWIGHTNFRITKKDFDILNTKVDGIGCLKVLSPYRFFIGIEKMFTFPAVRIHAQNLLCGNMNMDNESEQYSLIASDADTMLNLMISKINDAIFNIKDSEKWAVFVGKDGEIKTIKNSEFESDLEYQNKLKTMRSLKNGNIITYDSL